MGAARLKHFEVEAGGYPPHSVTALTASKARMQVFRIHQDAFGCTFREFLAHRVKVRRAADAPLEPHVYSYIRRCYGLDVRVGQRVLADGKPGEVALPGNGPYVYVLRDGEGQVFPYHPNEVAKEAADADA